jgi:plastocyanin
VTSLAGRTSLPFRVGIVMLVVAACTATNGSRHAPPPPAPAGGAVIVAEGLKFDRMRLDVPAGVAFGLLFENRDGAPHNVTILDRGGASVFEGETFGGPGSRTYAVPALPAGEYAFRCDVHREMAGTIAAARP